MGILSLCAAARPWKPISWSYRGTVIVLTLLSCGSLELGSECCSRGQTFLCATPFSTRLSRSVSLCGLPLRGWAVVAPRHFDFTITSLTVARGSPIRAEIWQPDLWLWPMAAPRWKSLISLVRPFYCQCLIIHLSATGVAEIVKSTHLKGCPHTTAYIV
jgi:hypothetical protein